MKVRVRVLTLTGLEFSFTLNQQPTAPHPLYPGPPHPQALPSFPSSFPPHHPYHLSSSPSPLLVRDLKAHLPFPSVGLTVAYRGQLVGDEESLVALGVKDSDVFVVALDKKKWRASLQQQQQQQPPPSKRPHGSEEDASVRLKRVKYGGADGTWGTSASYAVAADGARRARRQGRDRKDAEDSKDSKEKEAKEPALPPAYSSLTAPQPQPAADQKDGEAAGGAFDPLWGFVWDGFAGEADDPAGGRPLRRRRAREARPPGERASDGGAEEDGKGSGAAEAKRDGDGLAEWAAAASSEDGESDEVAMDDDTRRWATSQRVRELLLRPRGNAQLQARYALYAAGPGGRRQELQQLRERAVRHRMSAEEFADMLGVPSAIAASSAPTHASAPSSASGAAAGSGSGVGGQGPGEGAVRSSSGAASAAMASGVEQLEAMGFPPFLCAAALKACGGRVADALEFLVDRGSRRPQLD